MQKEQDLKLIATVPICYDMPCSFHAFHANISEERYLSLRTCVYELNDVLRTRSKFLSEKNE